MYQLLILQKHYKMSPKRPPIVFMALPPIGVAQTLHFGLSICECMLGRIQACIMSARYLTKKWIEFHQTLAEDVVQATDELIRFWRLRGRGQCHSKVKYLSELLQWMEASTSTLGCQSIGLILFRHYFHYNYEFWGLIFIADCHYWYTCYLVLL